jgi:hypothetical protein
MCYYTIRDIKAANKAANHHWFEPDTMRFFNSRICRKVLAGGFFVTSERYDCNTPRRYTVRLCLENGHIETIGDFQQFASADSAYRAIVRLVRDTTGAAVDAVRDGTANPDTLKLV